MDVIRAIRNLRAKLNVPPAKRAAMTIVTDPARIADFQAAAAYVIRLAGAESVQVQGDKAGIPEGCVSAVSESAEVYIPLKALIDVDKERERLQKEIAKAQNEISRAQSKLSNESFVAKDPARVIDAEREKLSVSQAMLEKLTQRLKDLG